MRRHLALAVAAAATVAVAWPADAGTTRTVTRAYTLATSTTLPSGTVYCCGLMVDHDYFGFTVAAPKPRERTVRVTISDDKLGAVAAIVEQSTAHGAKQLGVVCGSTSKSLRLVNAHDTVVVRPAYGACGTSASVPTTGTVTFRFTR